MWWRPFKDPLSTCFQLYPLMTFSFYLILLCNLLKLPNPNSVLCRQQWFPQREQFDWLIFSQINRSKQVTAFFLGNQFLWESPCIWKHQEHSFCFDYATIFGTFLKFICKITQINYGIHLLPQNRNCNFH